MHDNKMPTSRLHDNKENTNLGLKGMKVTTDLSTKIIHSPAYDCQPTSNVDFKLRLAATHSLALCVNGLFTLGGPANRKTVQHSEVVTLDTVPERCVDLR